MRLGEGVVPPGKLTNSRESPRVGGSQSVGRGHKSQTEPRIFQKEQGAKARGRSESRRLTICFRNVKDFNFTRKLRCLDEFLESDI